MLRIVDLNERRQRLEPKDDLNEILRKLRRKLKSLLLNIFDVSSFIITLMYR